MKIVRKEIKNTRDVDLYIKDALGIEHVIFPGQIKKICILKKDPQTEQQKKEVINGQH